MAESTFGGAPLFESKLSGLTLERRGKVRDVYALDKDRLLIVATDRLSAFMKSQARIRYLRDWTASSAPFLGR